MKKLVRSKKALSPVIATVILVAVTIVVAVSVSFWMAGIAGVYTRFEKVEVTSCYAVKDAVLAQYNITVQLKNSGSQDSTIAYVLVNGKPTSEYTGITVKWEVGTSVNQTLSDNNPMTIPVGQSGKIYVKIVSTLFESGTTLDLKFHSAAGKDYPQMLSLP